MKYIALTCSLLTILTSCSIQQFQTADDVLYTGVKSIKIEGQDIAHPHTQQAIAAVEEVLAYAPNNALLGSSTVRLPLPLVGPWLYLNNASDGSWLERQLHKLGTKPIWIRTVNPKLRARVAEKILGEQGYLGAQVTSQILHTKDSLSAKVGYNVQLGPLYLLDSVSHLPRLDGMPDYILDHAYYSPLQRGTPFSLPILSTDRTLVSTYLREEGYRYFSPDHIRYEADTLATPGAVQLRARLVGGVGREATRPWYIDRVRVRFLDTESYGQRLASDTVLLSPSVVAYYSGELPIRRRVLDQRIRLRPDSLYRHSLEDLTLKSLASIGSFSGIEMQYTPMAESDTLPAGSPGRMDMTILMRRDKPWDVNFGVRFMLKSTDFMGPGLSAGIARRNIFGGGETFSLGIAGSYEWQTGSNPFRDHSLSLNSYYLNVDASLIFPTLIIPGRLDAYYDFPTTTTFKLSGQRMNRAGYYQLNSLTLSTAYDFTSHSGGKHSIVPLSISYNQLGATTARFRDILRDNPSLGLSLMSQLIPQMSYTYTYESATESESKHRLWIRSGISQAGNITKAIFTLLGNPYSETQQILGVPYAQFVKAHSELRYTYAFDRRSRLAVRLGVGAIYSYGNAVHAPYMEQFFVGGANSIRAFTVRSLGPGSFRTTNKTAYTFMDHVGESKLELNAEWRTKLTGSLDGALFLDTGNIWLLRRDPTRPGGSLGEIRSVGEFLNQIAVGTGFGLRYDLGYLVVRGDVGIGLHLPYETTRRGWYNIPRFTDGLGIHLAIGYPF